MIFLDKSSKRAKDENGFLTIKDNPIAVAGVFDYLHSELFENGEDRIVKVYRDFEDLKKIKDTFANKPIIHTHKWAGDETKQVDGAIASEIRIDEDNQSLVSDLIIYNPDLIDAIESGKDVELSPGYTGNVIEEEGRYKGQSYQYRQFTDVVNHLAVVENGRAGDNLKIQDSKNKINEREDMKVEDKKFLDTLKRILKFKDEEIEAVAKTEDEDATQTEKKEDESIFNEIDAIKSNSDMSEEDKIKAIKSLVASYGKTEDEGEEKTEDEEPTEKKEDEDTVEKDDKVEEIAEAVSELVKKEVELKFADSNKQVARIQDAYDNVSAVLGTSFNRNGMSANDIYAFGYESLSGQELSKDMDAKTAFGIVSQSYRKPSSHFQDSKAPATSGILDYLEKNYR